LQIGTNEGSGGIGNMKGRKPKTAERQITEGDPSKRGMGKLEDRLSREAQAREGFPDCPKHLRGRARAAWEFLAVELGCMDQDRRPDAFALEGACAAYARAVEADGIVARDGALVDNVRMTSKGDVVTLGQIPNPAILVSTRAWNQFRQFAVEFGLTPISRTRLSTDKPMKSTSDDLAALLATPRVKRESVQ
jgi:P27 family predicted phage terminase small subunit